jgi:hypothetical protein
MCSIKIYTKSDKLPNLTTAELKLLRQKQNKLEMTASETARSLHPPILHAMQATLIFAADHAGTAVIVLKEGLVLTCAHCFAESREEYETLSARERKKWALFYDGTAVLLELVIWDGRRDLAMCRMIGLEIAAVTERGAVDVAHIPEFASLSLAASAPKRGTYINCIGQPGAEDLESDVPGTKTKYNLFEISEGRFRGLVKGQDVNNNEEIGCLMHGSWTYWGHSGAPLFTIDANHEVRLIGLHSSWDDQTAMRHGVPWEAIHGFLDEHAEKLGVSFEHM